MLNQGDDLTQRQTKNLNLVILVMLNSHGTNKLE